MEAIKGRFGTFEKREIEIDEIFGKMLGLEDEASQRISEFNMYETPYAGTIIHIVHYDKWEYQIYLEKNLVIREERFYMDEDDYYTDDEDEIKINVQPIREYLELV